MKSILIKSSLIITLDSDQPDFFYGDILIEDNLISQIVGQPGSIGDSADQVIDGSNMICMPGLINTHGHAGMTLLRSYADDLPLQEWLEEKIWPIEAHLTDDDIYWGTMLALAEMIKGGTTTFTDMYFAMERVAEAVSVSGMRAVLSRGMIGLGPGGDLALQETAALIDNWQGADNGRINIYLGPHAPYTCPPEFLKKVIELATRKNRPLQIHLSETEKEVADCLQTYGIRPPQLLKDLGIFEHKVIAAHCVHLNESEIELLAEYGVGVAHNPGSNLKLGSGIAPLAQMLQKGVKVGLGTDGASSNNNLDLLEEMRLATLLAKGVAQDPTLVNAKSALQLATCNGADALHLEKTGKLKAGYLADLIAFKKDQLHLTPLHDPLAHIVYAAHAADVELVIVDGQVLLEDGVLRTIDEEKVKYEASRCAMRLIDAGKE